MSCPRADTRILSSMSKQPNDIDQISQRNAKPVIEDPEALPEISMRPIGVVHSGYLNHFDTPRQPNTGSSNDEQNDATILIRKGLQNMARDLVGIERIWIIFQFNYSRGVKQTVVPPRDNESRGLFATRSPHRPNPIGLSCVRLLNVVGRKITIRDHDLLHGTAVLDIKPYLPYCESWPEAKTGWIGELDPNAPDHRWD
jgi:tRNA-Thr(GGU) m(6)t(6)A37 methyltransferase TsaA